MQERPPFCAIRPIRGNEVNLGAKMAVLLLLSSLLISYGVDSIKCSTVPGNSTDMLSLLDFKPAITNDPRQALSSWNASIPHCQWEGVNCSLTHKGRVTVLNLTRQNLEGQIAPSLENLTFLRSLDLRSNGFFGQLPTLNRLHKLQDLILGNNMLRGFNPDAITNCSSLHYLDLSANSLKGSLPTNIGPLADQKNSDTTERKVCKLTKQIIFQHQRK
ncbi:hypothetical protein CFC21_085900 [Triticum aestivum]|uniref:Leucine-rich repeat-containing N-terminal plant-type domain-containing protein n=2 Tax=Triticum aestivum TaxID=4565 RepID=A0A9R1IE36_WHEAT|nr:hypothetical protein CFC21_085900 [Triticum aestivum]